ncbi:MAG: PAS domain S-box protein [Candidatus Cloacimonadaceae bacterium]
MDIAAINQILQELERNNVETEVDNAAVLQALRDLLKENEVLKQQRDKYRGYLQKANDVIMLFDLQGNMIYINHDRKNAFEYEAKELLNRDFIGTYVHPDDAPILKRLHRLIIEEKRKLANVEHRVRHKEGIWHWVLTSLTPILDANGEVESILAISRSNQMQKMSEQKILAQNYHLNLILNTMHEGVLQVDNDDRVLYVNPSFCRLYGYSEAEVLGKIGYDLFTLPEHKQQIIDENQQRLEGISNEYIIRGKKKDGSLIWVRVSGTPVKDEEGKVSGSLAIMTNFTQRQQVLEDLRISEERNRSLFENAFAGIYQFTLDGKYLNVNQSFARIFGYDSPQAVISSGKGIADYAVDVREHEMIMEKLLLEGKVANEEIQMRRRDGRFIWVLIFATIREDINDQLLVEGSCVDITDIKGLREQVIISQRSEAIARLAAGIAHDFNNFLTIILGYTEDMMDAISPDSLLYTPAAEILRAGTRAANLTRQLLAFSSKQILTNEEISINSLINNLGSIISRILQSNVHIKYQLSENLPLIKMDAGQLEQVLINIITNAKEALPQGGDIVVSSFLSSLEENPAALLKSGLYVNLSVSDNGIGMDKDTLAQVFDPFFTTKKEVSGVGLGLSAALGVIRQAGGDILCESEPDKGTTFRIMLPALKSPQNALPQVKEPGSNGGKGRKLLIVEDDEALGKMMQKLLINLGYRVLHCLNSDEALSHFHENEHQDLVIIDLAMPGMDGWSLANAIRQIKSEQKILMMAGYGGDLMQNPSFKSSDIPFVQKPFSLRSVQPIIADLLVDAPKPLHFLIVDPEEAICKHFEACCERAGHFGYKACNFYEASKAILNKELDCIFINIDAPEIRGSQLAQKLLELDSAAQRFACSDHPEKWQADTLKSLGISKLFERDMDCYKVIRSAKAQRE